MKCKHPPPSSLAGDHKDRNWNWLAFSWVRTKSEGRISIRPQITDKNRLDLSSEGMSGMVSRNYHINKDQEWQVISLPSHFTSDRHMNCNFLLQMEKGQILVSTAGIFFSVLLSFCVLKKLVYSSLTQATEKDLELTSHKHRCQNRE